MAHTATDYEYLRDDLKVSITALTDSNAAKLFTRAELVYPTNTRARDAHARVLAIRGLIADAVKHVDYDEGEASVKASQTRVGLEKMLKYYQDEETAAVEEAANALGGARFGGLRKKPTRLEDYPNS